MADWWDILDGQMASQEPTRTPRRSIAINYPPELYRHVLAGARERGMSMTAYQRRAALAFAEHDTGFNWLSEMELEPPVGGFEKPGAGTRVAGTEFGFWRIVRLDQHG